MTEHKSPWRVRMEAQQIKLLALVDRPFPAIVEDAGGYYCLAKRADAVISRLDRELAAERENNAAELELRLQTQTDLRHARALLSAEKALADELHADLVHSGISMNRTILKYRKARGL